MSKADKAAADEVKMWDSWVGTLTPEAQSAIRDKGDGPLAAPEDGPDDEEMAADFAAFRKTLTPAALEDLDDAVDAEVHERTEISTMPRYCMVIAPDGELPSAVLYKTVEGLVRKIGELDGQDVAVWAFYGILLPITKGPQRYVLVQDGQSAVQVPMHPKAKIVRQALDLIDGLAVEEDGYLGDRVLMKPIESQQETADVTQPPPEDDETEAIEE